MEKQFMNHAIKQESPRRERQRNKKDLEGFVYPSYDANDHFSKMLLFRPKDHLTNYLTEYFN